MSFFSSVKSWFEKFFKNTTWEQAASSALALLAPGLETVVALTAGEADAAEIASVVGEVTTDLGTVSQLLLQVQSGTTTNTSVLATIETVLNSIASNLAGLLAAGHIKDPATVTQVTAITKGVVAEIDAILAELPKS